MKKLILLFFLAIPFWALSQNHSFPTAIEINEGQITSDNVMSGTTNQKYYFTKLPEDGTIKIYVEGINTGTGNGYLYMYGNDRKKNQVFNEYIQTSGASAGSSVKDTILVYGRAVDTFYFRILSSSNFSFKFRYEMIDKSENDVEPNNTFTDAIKIESNESKQGHIGYLFNGTNDPDDYYYTVLPEDGTVKIYVEGTNYGSGTGYLYMYGYDRKKNQVFNQYIDGTSFPRYTAIKDTLLVYGRAADTFYFRIISSQPYAYKFRYEMIDTSPNDTEPNDRFEDALLINPSEEKQGHIGYLYNGTRDQDDYYYTVLPQDGTIKIYVEGTNNGTGSGYLYMYGYDGKRNQVFSEYIRSSSVPMSAMVKDTIVLPGRAVDTFYFRIISSQSFSYKFSYEIADISPNDAEPNNDFASALKIQEDQTRAGHVRYLSSKALDSDDYYFTVLPQKDTIKVYVKGINRSSGSGYLYIYGYNRNKTIAFSKYIQASSVVAGTPVSDTITLIKPAADTFYFRINASTAFEYQLRYKRTDNSIILNILLGDFSATTTGNKVHLEWNTLGEDPGDSFDLERSTDGRNFHTLSGMKANGYASAYSLTDDAPSQGRNYYRLKLNHVQGGHQYSKVVVADVKNDFKVQLYPNPVQSTLTVQITGPVLAGARIILRSSFGQKVYEQSISGNETQINTVKLPAGIYFLQYKDSVREETFKVIKK